MRHRTRRAVFALLVVVFSGWSPSAAAQEAPLPACTSAVPALDAPQLTPPDASVPPALGALVGVWEGITSIGVPNRLVVEHIDGRTAVGVRLNGDGPGTDAAILRFAAQASPDGHIEWRDGNARFSYAISAGFSSVQGTREQPGAPTTTVTLTRCTWS